MQALLEKIKQEIRGVWRFRRYALVTAWVVCLFGWAAVYSIPDRFEARARVNVDTKTALKPLLQGLAIDNDVPSQLNIVRQALVGTASLSAVASKLGLDSALRTPAERQQFISDLSSRLEIALEPPATRDPRIPNTFYRIGFRDENRDTALAVVDALLTSFVETTMGSERTGTQKAQRFFQEQLASYNQRLGDAEARLAEFKKKNAGLVPGEQGDYFQRLEAERTEVNRIEAALVVANSRRAELQRQLRGETPFVPVTDSAGGGSTRSSVAAGSPQDTSSRIQETQARLDDLLLRFTDRHPDVVATRETLQALRERQTQELAALKRGDRGVAAVSGASSNPVYQNIQLQLNQTDVEVAALRGQLADHRRVEADLRRLVDTAPEVEAEYARLTRDYDVTKTQYNNMLERLERARLSEDAEETGVIRFDIVDPPSASTRPVFPNRPVFLAAVLFAGVVLGVAVAWLMHQMKPVFSSARSVTELTGLPVLGSVSRTWLEKQQVAMRRGLLRYSAASGLLLVVFIMVVAVQRPASQFLRDLL